MRKTQTEVTCAADRSRLNKMPKCKRAGPHQSTEDMLNIFTLVRLLVKHVTDKLPIAEGDRIGYQPVVLASHYWKAQHYAHEIEQRVNLRGKPFKDPCRQQSFCMCSGPKVKKAAAQFLENFDKLNVHYEWHTDASRDKWQEYAGTDSENPTFTGRRNAVQEPPPVPVNNTMLAELLLSADDLRDAATNDPSGQFNLPGRSNSAKAMQRSTVDRVMAALRDYPEANDTEIARIVGVSRPHLYRLDYNGETYPQVRTRIRDERKCERAQQIPRGLIQYSEDGEIGNVDAYDPPKPLDDEEDADDE